MVITRTLGNGKSFYRYVGICVPFCMIIYRLQARAMLCAFRVKKPFAFSAKWLSQKNVKRLERIDVRGRILITCLYLPFVKSFLM